jgi:starch synthase
MRIGYVMSGFLPSRETDTQQALKTVDALGGAGAEVELIVPESRRMRSLGLASFEAELRAFYSLRSPFRLVGVRGIEPDRLLEFQRPVHALRSCLWLPRDRYDAVYTRSRAAPPLCILRGQPVVFETYRTLGSRSPWLVALYARLARRPSFLGIVTHSHLSRLSIAGAGFPAAKLATIHNGHDPADILPRLARDEARARLGLDPTRPLCCYAGNVGARKGVSSLLDVAALTPEIEYLVVGGHAKDVAALEARGRQRGLSNLRCLGWRPATELPPFLYAADVLVIPPTAEPLQKHGRTVLPMKTFLYLAAGRPIIAPDLPDLREVLTHGESAWLVPPDQAQAAAAAIRRITADPELAGRLASGARERSAGLTWRARASRILEQIEAWKAAEQGRAQPASARPDGP